MKNIKRRTFLKTASAASIGALTPIKYSLSNESINGKILVVLELSGGNDGLNTIVPYGDDNYYKHRPKIGLKENKLLKKDLELLVSQVNRCNDILKKLLLHHQ